MSFKKNVKWTLKHMWQRIPRLHTYTIAVTIMALVAVGAAAYETKKLNDFLDMISNNYNRAFHEAVDYVENIDTLLSKSLLVNSPEQMAMISSEIQRQAMAAKADLEQLPVYHIKIDDTSKFLSQVGDYSYLLSQKMISEEPVTQEEYDQLKSLGEYATNLNKSLTEVQSEVYSGNLKFARLMNFNDGNGKQEIEVGGMVDNIKSVEKTFQDYPALIYDGPFSEHIEKTEPKNAPKGVDIGAQRAREIAVEFLGEEKGRTLTYTGEDTGTIEAYSFEAYPDGNTNGRTISIQVTKAKGDVLLACDNRDVTEENLSFEQATQVAFDFLNSRGITSMKESYYEKNAGIATINFAYLQDDIIIYPDLVKVKVALDNGEILGLESRGYIMAHEDERDLPAPALSEEEARAKVNPNLEIEKANMAVIATDSLREVLCYEFTGKFEERNFIVYINAQTGREEQIMLLLESESGVLTI